MSARSRAPSLREQICAGRLADSLGVSPDHTHASEESALLPSILMKLKQLQNKLVEVQREVQHDIQAVEKVLPRFKDRSLTPRE